MTQIDNLSSFTNLTTPGSPWAVTPAVVCDFGWYNTSTGNIFGNLIYTVAGNTYPPSGARFQDYITPLNQQVTFDVSDSTSQGIPKTVTPSGVSVLKYQWDLGNGITGEGPIITTTYLTASPDAAATLTIIDSLGRQYSTTHRLNLVNLNIIEGSSNRVVQGTGRH